MEAKPSDLVRWYVTRTANKYGLFIMVIEMSFFAGSTAEVFLATPFSTNSIIMHIILEKFVFGNPRRQSQ